MALETHLGWEISYERGPGCLGPETHSAIARQNGEACAAYAGDAKSAEEMIKDMIKKRTKHPTD